MDRNEFAEVTAKAYARQYCTDNGVMNNPVIVYDTETEMFSSQSGLTPTDDMEIIVLELEDGMFGEYDPNSQKNTYSTLLRFLADENDDLWQAVTNTILGDV